VLENRNKPPTHVNLAGVAIGNGLVNLAEQAAGYYQFARINNYIGALEAGVFEAAAFSCKELIQCVCLLCCCCC
jgi:hypothetical protein